MSSHDNTEQGSFQSDADRQRWLQSTVASSFTRQFERVLISVQRHLVVPSANGGSGKDLKCLR